MQLKQLSEALRVIKRGVLDGYEDLEGVVRAMKRIRSDLLMPFQMRAFGEVKKVCFFLLFVCFFILFIYLFIYFIILF